MYDSDHKVNIALIGYGTWGVNLARVVVQDARCNLYAICDSSEEKLKEAAHRYGSSAFTTNSYKYLYEQYGNNFDAVIVATDVSSHYEIVRFFLERNKHVLCEKPLCKTTNQAKELGELANHAKLKLMTSHIFLFNDGVRHIKKIIDGGEVGEVLNIHFQRTGLGPVREDINVLFDLAPHDISILLFLLGKVPVSVVAQGITHLSKEREDMAYLQLFFDSHTIAGIHVSWLHPYKERKMTIVGSKKTVVFDDVSITEKVRVFDKGISYQSNSGDFGAFQLAVRDGDILIPKLTINEPLKNQLTVFLNSIEYNTELYSDYLFSAKVISVIEAANISLANDNCKVNVVPV
jgi:predicted dehydrogenase